MPSPEVFLKSLFEQSQARGSRSTALGPLFVLLGLLLTALVTTTKLAPDPPTWLLPGLFGLVAFIVLVGAGAYIYLLIKDRDALRSERYSIQKLAIEKGMYGDDMTGVVDLTHPMRRQKLSAGAGRHSGAEPHP